jgi:hypothetical protein
MPNGKLLSGIMDHFEILALTPVHWLPPDIGSFLLLLEK